MVKIAVYPEIEDLALIPRDIMVPKEGVSSIVEVIMKEDRREKT